MKKPYYVPTSTVLDCWYPVSVSPTVPFGDLSVGCFFFKEVSSDSGKVLIKIGSKTALLVGVLSPGKAEEKWKIIRLKATGKVIPLASDLSFRVPELTAEGYAEKERLSNKVKVTKASKGSPKTLKDKKDKTPEETNVVKQGGKKKGKSGSGKPAEPVAVGSLAPVVDNLSEDRALLK
jgi:hypothetical protein